MPANEFSREWYETFLDPIPPDLTGSEVAWIERQAPPERFPRVLDVCCGPGRHAAALAARGYRVAGVDANGEALTRAARAVPGAVFWRLDMRALDSLGQSFDLVTNLWHSFGYFDDATNAAVLRQMGALLLPEGRLLIDVYNRDHIATLPLEESYERGGRRVKSRRSWDGPRHRVELEYEGGGRDEVEFRLYDPAEFQSLAREAGLSVRLACAWFRESLAPSAEHARMQFVLARGGA